MLKKILLTVSAVVLLACVSDLFAQEEPLGPEPGRKGLRRRGRAAKELRKYEGEIRAEKKGFKRGRAERFEGWGRRGFGGRGMDGWCPWGRRGGQGWQGRGGRGFGGQGMEGWCPWGQRRGQGWQGRGGRGMRRPRGRGDRSFGPRMGTRGRGRRFGQRGMHRQRRGVGFGQRGFDEDIASWHRRGEGMRGRGMRRPWMRVRGGDFGYGRRGPAKRQRRSPSENDFDWDW
jgi:hypothetical protein